MARHKAGARGSSARSTPRRSAARPVDKSKQNAPAAHTDIVMLGWNEEVQWRGEGLRAQLHGAAAALRPSAHGAGESWKNFILQTQGIAGNPATFPPLDLLFFLKNRKKKSPLSQTVRVKALGASCGASKGACARVFKENI